MRRQTHAAISRPCWILTNGKKIFAASWNRQHLKATKPCHEILQADVVGRSKKQRNKMKTLAEKIAVMQAAEKGAKVCFIDNDGVKYCRCPILWNWANYDYDVVPEPPAPKYRAWKTVDEVPVGAVVKQINGGGKLSIGSAFPAVGNDSILVNGRTAEDFFREFRYLDGTPCGVLEA